MVVEHDDVGPYRVTGPLGRGGNSAVVRAIDLRSATTVALKLRPRIAEPRFARELAILHAVEHPRIIRGIEAGVAGERAFLALELVDGVTLRELVDGVTLRELVEGVTLREPRELVEGVTLRELRELVEGVTLRELVEGVTPRELVEGVTLRELVEGVTLRELREGVTLRELREGVKLRELRELVEGVTPRELVEGVTPRELVEGVKLRELGELRELRKLRELRELDELAELGELGELGESGAIARVLAQLREAVEHLHGRGFVHGDLQPANVIVDADGNARLCDFGSAGRIGEVTPAGVASYASPERRAGAPLDPRDDHFSLARLVG